MAEKFVDLVGDICGDHVIDIADGYAAAHDIFGWLDENPDRKPRPTVTRSKVEHVKDQLKYQALEDLLTLSLGIDIVDDPAPTNAERIAAELLSISPMPSWERQIIAEGLDKAGVKAPETDNGI